MAEPTQSESTPDRITVYDCEHGFPPPHMRCAKSPGATGGNNPGSFCSCPAVTYHREDAALEGALDNVCKAAFGSGWREVVAALRERKEQAE